MGNFCQYCGRELLEGENCDCLRQASTYKQQEQNKVKLERIQTNAVKKDIVPKKLVPIGQIVAGGILVLFALMCGGYDWGYISFFSGAVFLLTGICTLINI